MLRISVDDAAGNAAGNSDPLQLTRHSLFETDLGFRYNRSLKIVSLPESAFTVTVDDEAVDFLVDVEDSWLNMISLRI